MGILTYTNVDDVDDRLRDYGALAKLYWARDNTSAVGAFADASGNTLLIAGQTAYEIYDATGQDGYYYRSRVGNTGGTDFTAWSDVFRAGSLLAYASVTDLREELPGLPDSTRDNMLADLLRDASDWLSAECGRTFYRSPQVTGTEVRTYDLTSDSGSIEDDIVSVSLVEYGTYTGGTFTTVTGSDYTLGPRLASPFSALTLTDLATVGTFYAGTGTVRVTGVFGFASVPRLIRRATLDLARELYQQSAGGRPVGIEFGRLPPSAVSAIERYKRRSYAFA